MVQKEWVVTEQNFKIDNNILNLNVRHLNCKIQGGCKVHQHQIIQNEKEMSWFRKSYLSLSKKIIISSNILIIIIMIGYWIWNIDSNQMIAMVHENCQHFKNIRIYVEIISNPF